MNSSVSLHSVAEVLAEDVGSGLANTNASFTAYSVPEDIRQSATSLPGVSEILATGSLAELSAIAASRAPAAKGVLEEYEEDFEEYSDAEDSGSQHGSEQAAHESPWSDDRASTKRQGRLQQAAHESPWLDERASGKRQGGQMSVLTTPVGIGAERFSSAALPIDCFQEEMSPGWDSSPRWSDSLGSGDKSPDFPCPPPARPSKGAAKGGAKALVLDMDEIDNEQSGSATWSWGASGTMHHKPSDTRITADIGITFQGRHYHLSPEDIEFDAPGGEEVRLGAGSGGVVSQGRIRSTGVPVAVKTIATNDRSKREQLINEIRSLVQAEGCPNLVQWYAGFVADGKVQVVLEFMDGGSLADLRARLNGNGVPLVHLACIAAQVLGGLSHLHSRRTVHRDIKPENILYNTKGEVKLTDFGIAKDLEATLAIASTFIGTATYMAPERCLGNGYSLSSDIWSVGMVIFELATGRYPFHDVSSFPALIDSLCERPEPRLDALQFPAPCCDFVAHCLTREVALRPDAIWLLGHSFVAVPASGSASARQELAQWVSSLPEA